MTQIEAAAVGGGFAAAIQGTQAVLAALSSVPEPYRETVLKFVSDLAQRDTSALDKMPTFAPAALGAAPVRMPRKAAQAAAMAEVKTDAKPGERKTRTRKAVALPPRGQSCRARILKLRDEGYFAAKRSPSEILQRLAAKGWTHTLNQVGASLTPMFEKGELQRAKENGGFKYYSERT